MEVSPQTIAGYENLGAEWRITHSVQHGIIARVIDKTTGREYARAAGSSESDAVEKALAAARKAEKPLTRSQSEDPVYRDAKANAEKLKAAEARIAELENAASGKGVAPPNRAGKKSNTPGNAPASSTPDN